MKKHVLILGAGFGGLELAKRLSETLEDAVRVTLLDRNDSSSSAISKLDVMLGRQSADEIRLPYSSIDMDGVEFRQETVTGIDPSARRVTTDAGSYDADFLVVAMGADYDMDATPGLEAGGHEYYTVAGAERLRDALAEFDGGKGPRLRARAAVQVPAGPVRGGVPAARVLHAAGHPRLGADLVDVPDAAPGPGDRQRSRRCSATRSPRGASRSCLSTSSRASIRRHGRRSSRAAGRCPTTSSSASRSTGRPIRSRPRASRSTAGCPSTRPTSGPSSGVYAIGDVCTGPRTVPKAGIFAESAALVVADDIAAAITGGEPPAPYGGWGICYAEFGGGLVSKVEVDFLSGPAAAAQRNDASREYAAEKEEFGAVRRARWFGH